MACNSALCSHQFDEVGFGASMDTIYNSPTVADLLISMAAAAASNPTKQHRQRFFACPNPPSDFVAEAAGQSNTADPDDNMCIKWEELQQVRTPATQRSRCALCASWCGWGARIACGWRDVHITCSTAPAKQEV